ncbi:nucleoside diphosphate kinase family protein [Vibrio parahaemolyticus VPCR-2010]|uniref:nucleoside-diphosphate kinase n=1 Tax=Vibrio parahaemolyticus TaxID=670 RepID=UPI00038E49C5|nr:nucleoside-diphosphate kinase [Vibrio parahaemolyticus]EJG0181575.1 nucleoside-diphosphate kinase [Vibrio parahaemolyticus]EQM48396.1 nucleoside diphosphate kinase family protein [Vibrio parahaemolyticus VPCR-2010]
MKSTLTFGLIKPNATKENLDSAILADILNAGFKLVALKRGVMTKQAAETFYAEHKEKPFFDELIGFMTSGEVVGYVIEAENAVLKYRGLMGATNPLEADSGTLRAKYAQTKSENSVHGSDSDESAKREIELFKTKLFV